MLAATSSVASLRFPTMTEQLTLRNARTPQTVHPEAAFAHKFVDNQVLAESVFRIGEYVADHGISRTGRAMRAARDLLLKVAPRLRGQVLEQARRAVAGNCDARGALA